ncbi:cytochrome bc complex cytochrome b subunit [Nonomuraea sp. NPDC050663]|uniref:cytochrome bc complex cytochrome b subunit n=1 Tax=Nonomuraea sp. NPDC050663 TaxID=3364370 RepID=UPI0037B07F20
MRREFRFSHWSFMFAEIALWSFGVLMVTGAILMFFFDPSMAPVTYDGTYAPLRGTQVSRAFDSTMHLSLEVRGGLLIRQMHHWAALVFVAAVALQLLRMFATAAYRRPRTAQWLIWVALLPLGMAAGETGHILPDDMLSGGSLWLIKSVLQSLPLVGSYGVMLLFGTDFPGQSVITTLYWGHALVIPAVMAALLAARAWLVRRNGHTHFTDAAPARPGARPLMAVATLGMLIVLGFAFQVAPIWLYGPARPTQISAGSVPDWYMGFLDGALRLMPGWEVTLGGYTLSLAVLVPVIVLPGIFFTVLALYPLAERRLLKGRGASATLERPRQAPVRTAIAVAGVAFYGLLWASAANDQFAHQFQLTVETVTIFFRYAVVIGPVVAFLVTRWICLGLQSADRHEAEHGVETGVIVRSPDGGFHERLVPAGHAIAPRGNDQTSEE